MANLSQAKKALKQSKKRALYNKELRMDIKNSIKKIKKAAIASEKKEVAETLTQTLKKLDKASQKGIIHKNTAARKKSRIIKFVNSAQIK